MLIMEETVGGGIKETYFLRNFSVNVKLLEKSKVY